VADGRPIAAPRVDRAPMAALGAALTTSSAALFLHFFLVEMVGS
jgi:hypothetical protein